MSDSHAADVHAQGNGGESHSCDPFGSRKEVVVW